MRTQSQSATPKQSGLAKAFGVGNRRSAFLPWWRKPVRMMRLDYCGDFTPFIQSDLDARAKEIKERWLANCEWVMATPGCAPGTAQYTLFNSPKFDKFPGLGSRDLLREYLPHARRHGIRVLAYINMHWYSYEFARAHPGWEQVLEDGTPYGRKHPLYGGGTTLCVNSPWRDWAFEMIREVVRTGVDGCFIDGPVFFRGACYCKSCRALFGRESGRRRMPSFDNWNDSLWKPFAEFPANSWARFMRDARSAAQEVNPEAVMFLNGGGPSAHNVKNAYDAERMEATQTFTGSEQFYHCTEGYDSPYKTLNLARYLSGGKNPGVVFTHHALSTWHYTPLPPAELATALAQTIAGGSNTWFAIFLETIKANIAPALPALETTGKFIVESEPYTTADRSAADTAVLISSHTMLYYLTRHRALCRDVGTGREAGLVVDAGGGQKKGDANERREAAAEILEHETQGCFDACNFGHVPFRVVWDQHLTPITPHLASPPRGEEISARKSRLSPWGRGQGEGTDLDKLRDVRVLVLPNAACLSRKQLAVIQQFVRNGGGVVATFESGMYDEWGEPAARKDWLRFLGIERVEGVFVPSRTEDYLTPTKPIAGFTAGALIPRPSNALAIRPTRDAQVLALYLNPINKSYTQPKGVSKYPAILCREHGKGRVVYMASPLFESFDRFHIDAHKEIARELIRLAAGRTGLQVETDAPGSLAIEVRAQPGRLLIHLVNVTSDMKRPMGKIIPLRDVSISLRARATSARCVRSGKTLKLERAGTCVQFHVPLVHDYEIVLLDEA